MSIPQNNDETFKTLSELFLGLLAGVIAFWKFVDKYFEDKKTQKKEFIAEVVKACIQSEMSTFKDDIRELKDFRENDRKYFDEKFDKIMNQRRS